MKLVIEVIDSGSKVYLDNFSRLNDKFERWDFLKKTDDKGVDSVLMLKDPSVFAYAFLKNSKGEPYKVTVYQDLILSCNHDFSPDGVNRFVLFKAANQIGKTDTLIIKAVTKVLTEDNITIAIVSKSLPQSQAVLANIKLMLNRSFFESTWQDEIGDQANSTILTFSRESGKVVNKIICAPSGEGLLGYPVHYLFLDEADFYEDSKNFFWKVAFARTNQTKGQIILFSNPNPDINRKDSLLFELWNGDLFRKKFSFNFLDAPWNTVEEYERNKRNTPRYIFNSTHNGEFSQDAGSFFTQAELDRMFVKGWSNNLPLVDVPVYLAVDFGKQIDNSVIVLGVPKTVDGVLYLDVRFVQKFELKTPYVAVLSRVKEIVDYYEANFKGVAGVGFDKTGIGGAMSEFVSIEKSLSVTDISWTNERKTKMFADFKLLVENDRFKIVYDEDSYGQCASLNFKYTPRGYVTVENKTDGDHDDIPAALAMLISIVLARDVVTPGFSFLDRNDDKKVISQDVGGWSFDPSEEDIAIIEEVNQLKDGGLVL